jgi:hypothetical protein
VGKYLDQIDAAPAAAKWPLVRQMMMRERHPFFAELQRERPVLELPDNLAFVTRYADCTLVLQRWNDFGVDLYKPSRAIISWRRTTPPTIGGKSRS